MTELPTIAMAASKAWPSGSSTLCSSGAWLQDGFEIDRHRMIARRDHVLLMHVVGDEQVEQREPGTGAAVEARAAALVCTALMIDELGPAIAVSRDGADRSEFDRGIGAIEPLDKRLPGDVEPHILRLVNDTAAVLEADDMNRTAVIMRIGQAAWMVATRPAAAGAKVRRSSGRSASSRTRNSRDVSIHCRATTAIKRSRTGFSANSARHPSARIAATNSW